MTGLVRWGGLRLARRLSRTVPYAGGLIAVALVGSAIRRKGLVGGVVDTGLNAVPFVGALKAGAEWWRGRDLIPDRPAATHTS
jgi:hypothetical protein